ncbi:MAG TPA: sigma-70 family RNA polymerase sigma factor [Polyangiaceae bacterium]|jgi:RNA polymerase sigma-32 factor|nr:sigma-70 family RNA polymerase sigma factor [Polyangiaceae bacterium]
MENSAEIPKLEAKPLGARLSRGEELELALRFQRSGDRRAADLLARAQQRDVFALAWKYRHYGLPIEELVAEGNFGVVHALHRFEPERGVRFVTYAAHWIRACIIDHIIRSWSIVRGGGGALRSKVFFKLRRERRRASALLGEGPLADASLAERLGLSPERLALMLQRVEQRDVVLESTHADDAHTELASPAEQEQVLLEKQRSLRLGAAAHVALAALDERERFIAQQRCMADPEDALSLAEIGRYFGVSRERARQLEERAKRKLRALLTREAWEAERLVSTRGEHA